MTSPTYAVWMAKLEIAGVKFGPASINVRNNIAIAPTKSAVYFILGGSGRFDKKSEADCDLEMKRRAEHYFSVEERVPLYKRAEKAKRSDGSKNRRPKATPSTGGSLATKPKFAEERVAETKKRYPLPKCSPEA